ncbi:hypothetical protein QL285_059442 [Trifolium repens]|nr:hypothetical protein QL285_059442 [Trifolium repens]
MNHSQEIRLILSKISSGSLTPLLKIRLFLARQIDQIKACQIKANPFLRILPKPQLKRREKEWPKVGGIIRSWPTHRAISYHTCAATSQCKNRCTDVSNLELQATHKASIPVSTPHNIRFCFDGILSRTNCHEMTLEGAALFLIFLKTNCCI